MQPSAGNIVFVLTALASLWNLGSLPLASSSTDGRQLPAYFCNLARLPENPTTLGGFIALFRLATNPGPNPQVQDGVTEATGHPLDAPAGTVLETQQLMASWHSALVQNTRITDTNNPIQVSVRGTVSAVTSTTVTPVPAGQLVSGALHALDVRSTPNGAFDINTGLDGAIIYASLDTSDANRVGSFVNTGPHMTGWLACGLNNVGIVHTQVLSNSGNYPENILDQTGNYVVAPPAAGLIWRAPNVQAGQGITFKGHGVTDLGFGPFTQSFTVVRAPASG